MGEPLILKPAGLVTAKLKVPLAVTLLIGNVYVGPEPLRVPLLTTETPLKVMSLAVRPTIALSKVKVNCVVVWVEEPFAVTLLKVTAVG